MAYTREHIQQMFQSQFDRNKWTDFIINFFKAKEVYRVNNPLDIDPTEGRGSLLGYLDTQDDYRIGFFYLKLNKSIDRRKVGLRQMIAKYIKIDSDAGIGVFDDGNHWRLSFITDLRGEKTSPKRYTFVFGDSDNQYRTAVDRFMDLQRKGISFANIKDAFSVEALTKQFYNDLFEWYTWALKDDTGVYFPNNPNTPDDDRENLDTKMIRLITRLMFVWFIKQKGLVPNALFDPKEVGHWLKDFDFMSMTSANYYQAILQNLFFATLNRPIKTINYDKDGNEIVERRGFAHLQGKQDVKSLFRYQELFKISEDKILSIFEFIPFINGGLFECLDKNKTSDGVEKAYYDDGFSRNNIIDKKTGRWTHRAFVPNKLFFDPEDGIISIFNRYNFTVEENSPSEQQVALDPELLGKVFENLLGVYNPETHDTARNQSGSFYTPREIVNYMVDISLQAYLGNTDEVKAIFADDFEYDENRKVLYGNIIDKLKTIKVLDPACGSGAFPMGMLNRIVEIMERLHAEGEKYDLKLQIMENCIYGGDIQTIAAQITKLRFFISLVCDCKKTDTTDDNYGIPNLPNLETHFVTCDSLIGLKKPQQYSLFEQDVLALKEKLKEVRHEHFTAKTVYQKTKLRDRDKQLRDELAEMLASDNVIASDDAKQMAAWNPYDQNAKSPFFDPEWMFGIKEGFDVVIGNPPYIQLQEDEGKLAKLYEDKGFKTFDATGDMYCLFYEQGCKLLKKNGCLIYITSNKWMKTKYGKKVRKLFISEYNPLLLIDFDGVKIFESAMVDTNILLVCNNKKYTETNCCITKKEDNISINSMSTYFNENHVMQKFINEKPWSISMSNSFTCLMEKINRHKDSLKTLNAQINYGIKTGFNPAYIIEEESYNNILNSCRTQSERDATTEIIKPLLKDDTISQFCIKWDNRYLINFHNGYTAIDGKYVEPLKISSFPAIKNHIDNIVRLVEAGVIKVRGGHKGSNKGFSKRTDCGITPYNLRSCAYVPYFNLPKIIWKQTSSIPTFTLDTEGFMLDVSGDFLYSINFSMTNLKCILGILNSDLAYFWISNMAVKFGSKGVRWVPETLFNLPISKKLFSNNNLAEIVTRLQNHRSDEDMEKLNMVVYKGYRFEYEDVVSINNNIQFSKSEYDNLVI